MVKITAPQMEALQLMASGELHGTSRSTCRYNFRVADIHGGVARALEQKGCVSSHPVMPDGHIVTDPEELIAFLGHWTTKYRITPKWRRMLRRKP